MLTQEQNDRLVRVGPAAPMGKLLRRFWTPALLASELPEPDCPPVRVRLLGEDLVAFRDSSGRIGILDRYCPHRRASLFWGRNEECGLRCAYHGWKFDADGNCMDIPNVPRGDRLKSSIRTVAYQAVERGGLVWCYMGPPEAQPSMPAAEVFDLPEPQRFIQKIQMGCNWVQALEGDIDSSHVGFLHRRFDRDALPGGYTSKVFADTTPRWIVKLMPYGMLLAAQRDAGPGHYSWRVNQWLMPYTTLVAAPAEQGSITNIRVPVDDEHTMHYRIFARYDGPFTEADWALIRDGELFPEMIPGTFETVANASNDFQICREEQRHRSFTGIKCAVVQDYAVTSDQGGGAISDRSRENLTQSDTAVVAVRRRLLAAAGALEKGEGPPEAGNGEAYRVRSIDAELPRDQDLEAGLRAQLHPAAPCEAISAG